MPLLDLFMPDHAARGQVGARASKRRLPVGTVLDLPIFPKFSLGQKLADELGRVGVERQPTFPTLLVKVLHEVFRQIELDLHLLF